MTTQKDIYLSAKQLAERYQVNRTTVWRWQKYGGFPEPVRFSPQCTRWRLADLEQWESERAERGA